jgi:hypothetical protein
MMHGHQEQIGRMPLLQLIGLMMIESLTIKFLTSIIFPFLTDLHNLPIT